MDITRTAHSARNVFALIVCLTLAAAAAPAATKPGQVNGAATQPAETLEQSEAFTDHPIEQYQLELLELAFETASSYPIVPHIKNRARAEEKVVQAAIELEQPRRAVTYASKIKNWRRGMGYADVAMYLAQRGDKRNAERLLEHAIEVAKAAGLAAWRRDRIRANVAGAYAVLGQPERVAEHSKGLLPSEAGKPAKIKARISDEASFEQRLKEVDALMATDHFDTMRNALWGYAELYKRFYASSQKRQRVQEKLEGGWGEMPGFIRLKLLMEMASHAAEQGDKAEAQELLSRSDEMFNSARWEFRRGIEHLSRLAVLRYRAGQHEAAKKQLDSALGRFEEVSEKMPDLYKARSVRPIAEAYQVMGDHGRSLKIYTRAVEFGTRTSSIRPLVVDLVNTCCSMAVHGVEPDEAMWKQMRQTRDEVRRKAEAFRKELGQQ